MLSSVPEQFREASFMGGQLVYSVLTELPAVYILYDSPFWSGVFLLLLFSVSVWNGSGYYIEVFGRKFERELEALRKELAESTARSGLTTPASSILSNNSEVAGSEIASDEELSSTLANSPIMMSVGLPAPTSSTATSTESLVEAAVAKKVQ